MRRVFCGAVLACLFVLGLAGPAVADPTGTVSKPGQHGQTCGEGSATSTPGGGNSSNSTGSPFNGGTSDGHYAGTQTKNSANGQSSQYDVACFQATAH